METGINSYIFVTAIMFGLGLYILLSSKEATRLAIGLVILFSSSIINISAFSGFWDFNAEGQILIFMISFICLPNIIAGIILFINHYKIFKINNFEEVNNIE